MIKKTRCGSKELKVSVFGAGNAGLTAAYHFTQNGCDVALYGAPGFDQQIHAISAEGGIRSLKSFHDAELEFSGFETITMVTTDIQKAVDFAEVLVLPVPSFAQETLFLEMLPYLRDGQTLVLMPGNYGSLVLNKLKDDHGFSELQLNFIDAISIPWATRVTGNAEIAILGMKTHLPVAAFPGSKTNDLIKLLQPIFPLPLTALENVIAVGFENINFGGHPLMTMLNIGLLENFPDKFNYYTDCCSQATANACDVLDKERLSVGSALGLSLKTELEAMNGLYDMQAQSVYELNKSSTTHSNVKSAPSSSSSRYITEDTPYLLVPCAEIAQLLDVDIPIMNSVIHITSAMNNENYFDSGRTLADMGLKGLTINNIIDYVS